jgi:hypothetical protein
MDGCTPGQREISAKLLTQFLARLSPGLLRDLEHWHRHESVNAPLEKASHRDHACRLERVGVGEALVTKWIVAGGNDNRGR